uniref:Uncharacterized protein n=1 Tax=Phocoena sinus TaxID=42100 RepID=A0A8C9BWD0_PHOSS
MPAPLPSRPRGGCGRSLDPHLQADVEHHRGHDVEVGEVHAQPPGQVEEGDQRAREPLAEGAVRAAGRSRPRLLSDSREQSHRARARCKALLPWDPFAECARAEE